MYAPFYIGYNYQFDHMRISGTEPSLVILSQTKLFKQFKAMSQKCQNKQKPKGMV